MTTDSAQAAPTQNPSSNTAPTAPRRRRRVARTTNQESTTTNTVQTTSRRRLRVSETTNTAQTTVNAPHTAPTTPTTTRSTNAAPTTPNAQQNEHMMNTAQFAPNTQRIVPTMTRSAHAAPTNAPHMAAIAPTPMNTVQTVPMAQTGPSEFHYVRIPLRIVPILYFPFCSRRFSIFGHRDVFPFETLPSIVPHALQSRPRYGSSMI